VFHINWVLGVNVPLPVVVVAVFEMSLVLMPTILSIRLPLVQPFLLCQCSILPVILILVEIFGMPVLGLVVHLNVVFQVFALVLYSVFKVDLPSLLLRFYLLLLVQVLLLLVLNLVIASHVPHFLLLVGLAVQFLVVMVYNIRNIVV
jgi:hypothetical protein